MKSNRGSWICLLVLACFLTAGMPAGATDFCGDIAVNTTWSAAGSPYVVTCDSTVASAATLTLDAGVEVRFQAATGLTVNGALDANGSSGNEVVFTSDLLSPQAGDWDGILFMSAAVGTLNDAVISYSTNGLRVEGTATLTLAGVSSTSNQYGLYVYNGTGPVTATGCAFTGNTLQGVRLDGASAKAPDVTITASEIHSNLGTKDFYTYRFTSPGESVIDATGNWWGSTDEGTIRARIFDHADHITAPMVDWCGYLDGPAGSTARTGIHCSDPVVCGGTTVWDQIDKPYLLLSDTVVCPTGVLEIGPGVQVRAAPHTGVGIEVLGRLDVNGLSGSEVTLLSDAAAPAAGDWEGLSFYDSGVGTIDHAVISHPVEGIYAEDSTDVAMIGGSINDASLKGVYGNGAAVTLDLDDMAINRSSDGVYLLNAAATLDNVDIDEGSLDGLYVQGTGTVTLTNVSLTSHRYGLYVYNADGPVTATGCAFTGNTLQGVRLDGASAKAPDVTITASEIHSNLGTKDFYTYRFTSPGESVIDATGNWWGSTDEGTIRARIFDHADHITAPMVDWCGYLDGPAGSTARTGIHCSDPVVCGGTTVWDQIDKPYLLLSDTVVCPTGVLEIGPGVQVRAAPHTGVGIEVLGRLDVNGLSGSEVTMLSDAPAPAAGDWEGLSFYDSGVGTIDHAVISHPVEGIYAEDSTDVAMIGGSINDASLKGVYANGAAVTLDLDDMAINRSSDGVYLLNAAATLDNVDIAEGSLDGLYVQGTGTVTLTNVSLTSHRYGLYVYNGTGPVTATGCAFTGNTLQGVRLDGASAKAPDVTITASSIHSNLGLYDLYTYRFINPASESVWVPDCWWGTTDMEWIRNRIYDREEDANAPTVQFHPFGDSCEVALGRDSDGDDFGDFEDNCPVDANGGQADADSDGMGDLCDPAPGAAPTGDCDGFNDDLDGYADADSDDWGDPCDFQPTRDDSYPGATELCDGRDNNGDGLFGPAELIDDDFDLAVACGDCDDAEPAVYPCACESCINSTDDDCDTFTDGADPDCFEIPSCIVITDSGSGPVIYVSGKAACGGGTVSGPYEVIRGSTRALQFNGGSVDLGDVACVSNNLTLDRVTDLSPSPNLTCNDPGHFFLVRDEGAANFGTSAPGGEVRDLMNPVDPCP